MISILSGKGLTEATGPMVEKSADGSGHRMGKWLRKTVIILFWLLVWQAAAVWIHNPILLAGPGQVLQAFGQNLLREDFLKIIFCSFSRIGLGFFLALFAGAAFGAASYRIPLAEEIAAPLMSVLKSVPVASFVVILLIWFGSGRLSFFICFLIVFPNVYVSTLSGLKSADEKLLEMARVFDMGRMNRFFYIYKPAVMPYLNSCLRVSLGMSWKSGVAAEVIGLPAYSLGERLYMSKIYLDTAGVLAWTLTVILISFLFEKAVLWLTEIVDKWKPYPITGGMGGFHLPQSAGNQQKRHGRNKLQSGKQADCSEEKDVRDNRHVRVSHVSKSYGGMQVLQDYSLTLRGGDRYLLTAPSGAGKTTLLRLLTGLESADRGTVEGVPRQVGMVFQEDRLCEEYDAVCNIMLGMGKLMKGKRCAGKQVVEHVRAEAAKILPSDCLNRPVRELSGGMRRRVALLRAVLSGADLLVLDEPFTGLDEENRIRCGEYLLEHLAGKTLLATSHRMEDVELLRGIRVSLVFSGSLCRQE